MMEDAKVIAMDEPTSSLTPAEFERLAVLIEGLAARGVSIIYVSHKMDEVFRVCRTRDRSCATAGWSTSRDGGDDARRRWSRDGRPRAGARRAQELRRPRRSSSTSRACAAARRCATCQLQLRTRRGARRRPGSSARAGPSCCGSSPASTGRRGGEIRIEGKRSATGSPRAAIAAGIGLLPEERKRDGIVARRSIRSNIALSSMHRFSRFGFVRQRALGRESLALMREMNLRPLDIDRPIGQFSGGNQQKAIIGRWIAAGASILLFDEPTRGIDVGAKAEIYALIERLAAEGRSMIVVSSELPEILRVSDRVLVMREGRIAGDLDREELTEEAIVAHAIPQSRDAAAAPLNQEAYPMSSTDSLAAHSAAASLSRSACAMPAR